MSRDFIQIFLFLLLTVKLSRCYTCSDLEDADSMDKFVEFHSEILTMSQAEVVKCLDEFSQETDLNSDITTYVAQKLIADNYDFSDDVSFLRLGYVVNGFTSPQITANWVIDSTNKLDTIIDNLDSTSDAMPTIIKNYVKNSLSNDPTSITASFISNLGDGFSCDIPLDILSQIPKAELTSELAMVSSCENTDFQETLVNNFLKDVDPITQTEITNYGTTLAGGNCEKIVKIFSDAFDHLTPEILGAMNADKFRCLNEDTLKTLTYDLLYDVSPATTGNVGGYKGAIMLAIINKETIPDPPEPPSSAVKNKSNLIILLAFISVAELLFR
ncbi:hypothetical protein SNEBB_001521 [Seison nebaliae]|nr:hypothetical protein SNEBB_001521 [Seison nebaliae]